MSELKVIQASIQPINTNVLWLNTEDNKLYKFDSNGWEPISGVEFSVMGEYDKEKTYYPNSIVTYNGSSYISLISVPTYEYPTQNSDYWNLLAQKGEQGPQGNSGYSGNIDELEVVNNLTDGGENSALSAEQGKRLKEWQDENITYINKVKDGSVVVDNTLSALDETSNKPVSGKSIASAIEAASTKVELNSAMERVTTLDGRISKIFTLDDIGIAREGYYIHASTGKEGGSANTAVSKPIYLDKGDIIEAYTGGTGFCLIGRADSPITNYTTHEVIVEANNMMKPVKVVVEKEGYYSFSGRINRTDDSNMSVNVTKYIQRDGVVSNLVEGDIIGVAEYTLNELLGDGALTTYYLNEFGYVPAYANNCVITRPIYLYAGDEVKCRTGGTGFCLVAKAPSSSIAHNTIFEPVSRQEVYAFNGLVPTDGWYCFSGRTNRTDGTNLEVSIKSYRRGLSLQDKLDSKVDKALLGELVSKGGSGYALSIGANEVKEDITASPWFDDVENDGTTFGTYLDDKIDSIPDGDSFIFITDTHYIGNKKQSAPLIDYIRRRRGIKTIIHGGDVINEAETKASAAKEWLNFYSDFPMRLGGDFKQVAGDHDHNGRYATTGNALSYQFLQRMLTGYNAKELNYDTLYDEQIKQISSENAWTAEEIKDYGAWKKMHYYFDDTSIHTRFIVLHTGWTGDVGLAVDKLGSGVTSEDNALYLQMEFLFNSLLTCPSGYNVVVVGHNVVTHKKYMVDVDGTSVPRYNVNEPLWLGAWQSVAKMIRAYKNKSAITLSYRDWTGDGLQTRVFDFYNSAYTTGQVICIGGDVHWDVLAKSTEDGETIDNVAVATTLDSIIVTEGVISKSDILHALTMTDGGDRGYRGVISAPTTSYTDSESILLCAPNTAGTLDAQAFDVITITDTAIHFTRFGAGNDRVVYIE